MRIAAVGRALPPNYYPQEELLAALKRAWAADLFNLDRLDRFHENVRVGGRHLALRLEEYERLDTWGDSNHEWVRVAQQLGEAAIRDAFQRVDIPAEAVGALIFVSVTGIATPSIDARLMNRLRWPPNVKRMPIFGLGCVAGAAGLARAADYVRAFPDQAAVLVAVELCSLTLQLKDFSIPNLVSSGLFGDGAAAAVVAGEECGSASVARARIAGKEGAGGPIESDVPAEGPRVLDTRSVFYPDSERVMGWDISERGFQVVLSPEVPDVVRRNLRHDVDSFLADRGLSRADISSWVAHPGGPKVLDAIQETLELPPGALDVTWRSLREVGNLSSASVLFVLGETMDRQRPPPGSLGILFALGPGFCSELVLLEW